MTTKRVNPWVRLLWTTILAGSIPVIVTATFGHTTLNRALIQMLCGWIYAGCIGVLCTAVLTRIARRVLFLPRWLKWPALVSVLIVLATIGCFAATSILFVIHVVSAGDFLAEYFQSLKISIILALVFGIAAFFHQVLTYKLNQAELELKAREEASEKLRQAALEARLSSLESRVQPHFLFNTLNSVLALIREDPAAAERMVERLAALLRFSLDANQSRLVPLSLEAKIVSDYLEIEQARFGSRLRFSIRVPPALESLPVPPLSLQTIVENSVKYAVSVRREGATIAVRVSSLNGKARLEVTDDGPGFPTTHIIPGHGLELLASRVEGLYGAEGSLEIASLPHGGASVTIVIPEPLTRALAS